MENNINPLHLYHELRLFRLSTAIRKNSRKLAKKSEREKKIYLGLSSIDLYNSPSDFIILSLFALLIIFIADILAF